MNSPSPSEWEKLVLESGHLKISIKNYLIFPLYKRVKIVYNSIEENLFISLESIRDTVNLFSSNT